MKIFNPLSLGSSPAVTRTAAFAALLFSAGSVHAASQTWAAAPSSGDWTNTANWAAAAVPGAVSANSNDIATFNSAISGGWGSSGTPIVNDLNRVIGGITFDTASVGAYTIGSSGGNILTFGSNVSTATSNVTQITANVTAAQTIAANIGFRGQSGSVNTQYTFRNNASSSAATLTLSGNITGNVSNSRPTFLILDGSNTGNNTISGNISDPAFSQGGTQLTKNGTGTWILGGTNTFTGSSSSGIAVNGGILGITNAGALGTGTNNNHVNINTGGTLQLGNGITMAAANLQFRLNDGGTVQSTGSTSTGTTAIVVNAAATSVTLGTVGSGDVLTVGSAANKFTGGTAGTTVTKIAGPGTVLMSQSSNYAGSFSVNSGTLKLGNTLSLGPVTTAAVTFGASSTGKLQLNGISPTIISLTTNATPGTPTVENGLAGTATLTVNNATANTYAGVLQNGSAGTLALTKSGVGALTLSGNSSTYSGATTISAGTLNVTNTSGSATGTSAVGLGAATLTGAGIISGTVTTSATSTINPGTLTAGNAGSGFLTLGNLSLTAGTNINFGLDSGNVTANYISTGTLTLPNSGTVVLNLYTPGTATAFATAGTYDLFQYTSLAGGALSTSFSFGTSIAGYNASFGTAGGYVQLTLTASGVLGTWTNGNANGNWSDAGNWSGGVPSAAGDSATFNASPGTVNLDANETIGGLTLDNAGGYTIAGANTLTFNNNGSGVAVGVVSGTSTISSAVTLADNVNVNTSSGAQLTFSGNIGESGSRSFTKSGAGTVVLSGTNSYTGGTTINAGTLKFSGLSSLGGGTTLTVGGASTVGALQWATGNTADISGLTVTVGNGGATFDTNGNDVVFANAIGNSGTGGINKVGAGKLTVAAGNTFTGNSSISGGTLNIAADTSLGAVPGAAVTNLTISGGGTLQFGAAMTLNANRGIAFSSGTGVIDTNGNNATIAGALSGSGLVNKIGAGTLTLTGATNSTSATGGITIDAGTVAVASAANLPSGTLTMNGTGAITSTVATNFSPVVNGTNSIIGSGSVILGLGNVTGNGTLTFGGPFVNDYTGSQTAFTGTIVSSGGGVRLNGTAGGNNVTYDLSGGQGISVRNTATAITIGALQSNNGASVLSGSGGGATQNVTYTIGAKTVDGLGVTPVDSTFAGAINNGVGTVSITKVGASTLTLTNTGTASTYTGTTLVSAGTLNVGGTTALGASSAVTVNGATAVLKGSVAAVTIPGNLTLTAGAIDIRDSGVGQFSLASGQSFSMASGTLLNVLISNLSSFDSIVNVANSGSFTISGGTLDLTGSTLATGNYNIFSGFSSGSGNFTSITGYDAGLFAVAFDTSVAGVGTLQITAVPEPHEYAVAIGGLLFALIVIRRRKARMA